MQLLYIQNPKMYLSKKILYYYPIDFFSCLGQLLLWKHFICHYVALSEKRKREDD